MAHRVDIVFFEPLLPDSLRIIQDRCSNQGSIPFLVSRHHRYWRDRRITIPRGCEYQSVILYRAIVQAQ